MKRENNFTTSQRSIQSYINRSNYCTIDDNCATIPPTCSFGCCIYVNQAHANNVLSVLRNHKSACYYECAECSNPICINKKCQAPKWDHRDGYADVMPNRAELKNRHDTYFHYDFQDESLFVEAVKFARNTLPSVTQEIEHIAKKGNATKIRIFIVGRVERWPHDYGYSYMGYRQAYNNTDGTPLPNLVEHIYHKDIPNAKITVINYCSRETFD